MTKYKDGDKSRAICAHCKLIVDTTFHYRDVAIEKNTVHILAGVCDLCDAVVSISAQATPAIKEALARDAASIPTQA